MNATSGTISEAGSKPLQARSAPPSAANAKPPSAIGPPLVDPGSEGSSGGSLTAAAASARQRSATVAKRSGPAAVRQTASPSAASARAPALGLLEEEPRLARTPRGADDRAGVDVARQRQRQRRQRLAAAAPRTLDGELQTRREPLAVGVAQRERGALRSYVSCKSAPEGR